MPMYWGSDTSGITVPGVYWEISPATSTTSATTLPYPWYNGITTSATTTNTNIIRWFVSTPTIGTPVYWAEADQSWIGQNAPPGYYEETGRRLAARETYVRAAPAIRRAVTRTHDQRELEWRERMAAQYAAERTAEAAERRRQHDAARSRANELLIAHLTPEQRESFETLKWFVVEGGRTKRKYRIHGNGGMAGNIEVIGENHRLCAHCDLHAIPLGDQLLAQKVTLELDEDHFLRTANRHPGRC